MSENSGLRMASTSPMLMVPVLMVPAELDDPARLPACSLCPEAPPSPPAAAVPCARPPPSRHLPGPPGARPRRRARTSRPRSSRREEYQLELADLQLLATDQVALLDPFPVEVGAVQRADVMDGEAAAVAAPDLGVPAGHGDVVEEDVRLGMPAHGHDVLVEQEAAAGVGAPADHQHRGAVAQLLDGGGDLFLDLSFEVLRGEADGGGRVVRGRHQRGPTIRAEVGPLGVLVTALSAEHTALRALGSDDQPPRVLPCAALFGG